MKGVDTGVPPGTPAFFIPVDSPTMPFDTPKIRLKMVLVHDVYCRKPVFQATQ